MIAFAVLCQLLRPLRLVFFQTRSLNMLNFREFNSVVLGLCISEWLRRKNWSRKNWSSRLGFDIGIIRSIVTKAGIVHDGCFVPVSYVQSRSSITTCSGSILCRTRGLLVTSLPFPPRRLHEMLRRLEK